LVVDEAAYRLPVGHRRLEPRSVGGGARRRLSARRSGPGGRLPSAARGSSGCRASTFGSWARRYQAQEERPHRVQACIGSRRRFSRNGL